MRQSVKAYLVLAMILLGVIGLLGLTLRSYLNEERATLKEQIRQELSSIVDIKVAGVARWRRERIGDANFIFQNKSIARDAALMASDRANSQAQMRMKDWMSSMRHNDNFTHILCLSPSGTPLLQVPDGPYQKTNFDLMAKAVAAKQLSFSNVFENEQGAQKIQIMVPLYPEGAEPSLAGLMQLTMDPKQSLFPIVQMWSRQSRSAELLLFGLVDNQVILMSPLRHHPASTRPLRFGLSRNDIFAVRAVLGSEGFMEGIDYRGVSGFCVARRIPDSPWYVLAKIDQSEIFSGMYREAALIGLSLLLIVVATGSTALLLQKRAQMIRTEKTAEQVRRNQSLLNGIIEGTADVIFAKDCDGRYLMINHAGCRVLGKSVEQIIGTFPSDHFSPREANCIQAKDKKVLESGELITYEESLASADGMIHQYLTTRAPIRSTQGTTIGVFGMSRDITLLKETEEQLRIYQTAVEQSPASIVITDVNGNIEYVNKRFSEISGYSALELIGKKPSVLKSGKMKAESYEQLWKTILSGGEWRGEICNKKKNGELYWEDAFISPLRDQAGNISHFIGIKQDITVTREMEQHMLHGQRMEAIGTLAGGIAHDLNNVLAPVLVTVELLKDRWDDPLARQLLQTAESAVNRGREIIRQVLSFARGMEGERIPIQPKHVLKEIDNILRETFPRSIQIENEVQPDLAMVSADLTQLHQVLMNLCVNARDAMDGKGKLKLGARNVSKNDLPPGAVVPDDVQEYVCFYVQDNGVGIPAELQERIFDPFFTTKGVGKGTGLGLSTTYTIVRKHGGFIDVQSQPGFGSLFSVYLPAVHSTAPQAETAERTMQRGAGEGVLIVDDEEFVRNVTQQMLEKFGYKAYLAEGGREAVKIYSQHHDEIAVVITDWMMPDMDGAATIRGLQQIDPAVRVIVSTGLVEESATNPAVAQNIRRILNKPYSTLSLLETLREVLSI